MQVPEDGVNLNALLDQLGIVVRAAAFPVGIDPDAFAKAARRAETGPEVLRLTDSLAGRALILGVDRMDYTKGLPHRFRGFAQLLRRFPEHRKQVRFLQIAPVSRGDVLARDSRPASPPNADQDEERDSSDPARLSHPTPW